MAALAIDTVATFDTFDACWGGGPNSKLLWQLLGQLDADEVLVRIPAWLAEEKAAFGTGAPPTEVVGRIGRETDNAVLLAESVAAGEILKLAHSIHELERDEGNPDRNDWLDRRLADHRDEFRDRYN